MSRWWVELKGEEFDLLEYRRHFSTGDFRIQVRDGVDYLCGEALDAIDQTVAVRGAAAARLTTFHAVLRLIVPNLRKPEVGTICELHSDGRFLKHHVLVAETGHFRMKLMSGGRDIGPSATDLLRAVEEDLHLVAATLLLAQPDVGWGGMYAALEELETSLGMNVNKAGFTTAAERERFTRSANSSEASGIGARHGSGKFEPPPDPMVLQEARRYLTQLATLTVRQAANRSRSSK